MKWMHTKLPEFLKKLKVAATSYVGEKNYKIEGLENLKSAKMQSLRTGRIEEAIEELARAEGTGRIEVSVIPRVPETMHTICIKSYDKNGAPKKAILEVINIIHPTEEVETMGFEDIEDRRPALGKH
uniref:hypothetical protein n=1 Tax=Ndongobacter massiliensis TaxID=1871025 RepID=UPI000930FD62|nr:hypothetical protein [Ndongobacter massiliensis]